MLEATGTLRLHGPAKFERSISFRAVHTSAHYPTPSFQKIDQLF